MVAAGATADVPEEDRDRVAALAKAMPYDNLLRAVSLALEADALARRVDDPVLAVQMLVLKLAELPRLRGIEEAIAGAPPSGARRGRAGARRRRPSGSGPAHRVARDGRAGARAGGAGWRRRPPGATRSSASTTSSIRAAA